MYNSFTMGKGTEQIYGIVKKHNQSPVASAFFSRIEQGQLTRDENINSHFCVYFAAYDPECKQVFIGLHKKSGLWLFNGGHIDKGETPDEAVKREISEEWGLEFDFQSIGEPKLITITKIKNEQRKIECKKHYDIWYFISVSKQSFKPKKENLESEFYEIGWRNIEQAKTVITEPNNLIAISELEKLFI